MNEVVFSALSAPILRFNIRVLKKLSKSEFGKMKEEEEESSALRDQIMHVEIIMYCRKKGGGRGTKRIFHFHLDTWSTVPRCAEHTELRSE